LLIRVLQPSSRPNNGGIQSKAGHQALDAMSNAATLPSGKLPTEKLPASQAASPLGRLAALPAKSKMALGAGTALLVAAIAAGVMYSGQPDYRVLFTGVADKDGGAIIAQLQQMNVPYKHLEGNGIMVPADKVHEVRLKLASQGLPKGGTVGLELMDAQKFGVTQFQEQVNFQRGLEGELSKSIMSVAAVQMARVHLAFPKQSVFMREGQKPSASVLLTLHPGKSLDRAQVAGIVHLVSSSVAELPAKNVSVLDQSGNLLSQTGDQAGTGLDATQLSYVARMEQSLNQRITDIVEPIVGRNNVRAQVTADVDFNQIEQTAELYKPNQGGAEATVRSTQLAEQNNGGAAGASGVPGALSNQPPAPATAPITGAPGSPQAGAPAGTNSTGKREMVTNYEVDKTVRHTRNATGTVKRLTAAVVVNHKRLVAPDGKVSNVALTEEQMKQINALVREAMGFSQPRGDSVNVVNAPFQADLVEKPEAVPFWKDAASVALGKEIGKALLWLLAVLVIVFGVIRPALKQPQTIERVVEGELDNDDPNRPALPSMMTTALPPDALPELAAPKETRAETVRRMAKDNPAAVANVVRAWVAKDA
jgi:flagellar M-ring protein FliF